MCFKSDKMLHSKTRQGLNSSKTEHVNSGEMQKVKALSEQPHVRYNRCATYKYRKAADESFINKLTETPIKLRVLTLANCCRQEPYQGSSKCQQTRLLVERGAVSRAKSLCENKHVLVHNKFKCQQWQNSVFESLITSLACVNHRQVLGVSPVAKWWIRKPYHQISMCEPKASVGCVTSGKMMNSKALSPD